MKKTMGELIAVTVLAILDEIDIKSAVVMLGIGLTCLAISSLVDESF